MAIFPAQQGLEVKVLVDGKGLHEYEDSNHTSTSSTTIKFVKAKSGANFEIWYNFVPPFPTNRTLCVRISVDGKLVDEPLHLPEWLSSPKGHLSSGALSKEQGKWKVQRFAFSELNIDEGDDITVSEELLKELDDIGKITVEFHFLKNLELSPAVEVEQKTLVKKDSVSEKAVKGEALSHQASLREPEDTLDLDYYDADYADGGPFATFIFYYRSLASLYDLHILPRPKEFITIDEDDIVDMSEAEVREALRQAVMRKRDRVGTGRGARGVHREKSAIDSGFGDDDEVAVIFTSAKKIKRLPQEGDEVIELD